MEKILQGRQGMIRRIAITGPESTGKTWLASKLAEHVNTAWIPEFARGYLFELNRSYNYDDLLHIAQNQYSQNSSSRVQARDFLFCDTELIVTKIWCNVKYGRCHPWIEQHILKQNFDLYLLTDIDLPWEPDPQREHPGLRDHLMDLYLKELRHYQFPFSIISGQKDARLKNAVEAIRQFFGLQSV